MTIQPNELRIGNWVLANNVNRAVFEPYLIDKGELIDVAHWFQPIPLDEEWLVKLGGDGNLQKGSFFFDNKDESMRFTVRGDAFTVCSDAGDPYGMVEFKKEQPTVHWFQNLFYSITGEELEVKP